MNILRKLSLALCASALVLGSAPASAQDVGGFINLMGRIIEQDMRNQEHRQQRQAEDRAARQRRQAAAQERKAREDAIRRQEIAYVRRLQTAMSRLRFYDMAIDGDRGPGTRRAESEFIAAFELPPVVLDDSYISEIEYLAQMGFRSARELRDATAAGFGSRDDLVAAREGGFENAQDFASAKGQGFTRFDDYRRFRASDFKNAEDYRLASKGGFARRSDFEAALAAGFAEFGDYEEFRRSGLPDKASFEEHRDAIARARGAADACKDAARADEVEAAVAECLTALVYRNQTNLLPELKHLDQRVSEALDGLVRATPSVTVAADGASNVAPTDAGSFLQKQAALKAVREKLSCGIVVASKDWTAASSQCAVLASEGEDVVQQLASLASNELQVQQNLAAEEERVRKETAETERRRLALNAGKQRLVAVLASIAEFTDSKRSFTNAIDVARAVVRLRQLEGSDDVTQIEQAILNIDDLLKGEPNYQQFIGEQKTAAEIAHVNARATATADLRRTEAFIADFVGSNIMHEAVTDLLELQETFAKARSSGQDEALFNTQRLAANAIDRLKLRGELDSFVYSDTARETVVEEAQNGLAVTDDNRLLLSGDPQDVIILGNYSPNAPHLFVNLVGTTTFEGGTASMCWVGPDARQPPLGDYVHPVLRKLGAEKITEAGLCDSRNSLRQDVLVIQRGALLSGDLLEAQPIISGFEAGTLKTIELVAWSGVGEAVQMDAEMSSLIKNEIVAGVRDGFGFIAFDNQADALCTVVAETDAAHHDHAFELAGAPIERHVPADMSRSVVSLDRAFANIQRNACQIVYAQSEDMGRLFAALDQIDKPASVLPIWITPELLEEGRAMSASSQQERERRIALRRQEMEATSRLQEEKSQRAKVLRDKAQNEMRARYSQEARAAHNDLSELSKAFVNNDQTSRDQFARMFTDAGKWRVQQAANGWEVDSYADELLDYGTAEWKDRRLEAVLIKASIVTKNPVRGEYENKCVILGYLIDREFEMRRDAVEAPCDVTEDVSRWKTARKFETRWIAP